MRRRTWLIESVRNYRWSEQDTAVQLNNKVFKSRRCLIGLREKSRPTVYWGRSLGYIRTVDAFETWFDIFLLRAHHITFALQVIAPCGFIFRRTRHVIARVSSCNSDLAHDDDADSLKAYFLILRTDLIDSDLAI
ncbi:hypothetical protein DPMN_109265 [Dreissena polymorpha]|uniref:Uncharacterized protein n=1 Tax=Dreissena polymorpha TaxID=45954 RepID=A0A9D4K9Z0_DREPO|nr:hypothetical protein DPMN_109265 [Dreissena polymorpha]